MEITKSMALTMINSRPSVSIVIPCLNEEQTLPLVLKRVKQLCMTTFKDRDVEVIVSDNGSTDRSVSIALNCGAKVIHCEEKGYGATLDKGIRSAKNEIVVFADADDTYDFLETEKLVVGVERGHALVIGSRLKGTIRKRAMPPLHRFLGTPLLNFFINLLYSRNNIRISDCNSGFRAFRRDAYLRWNVKSSGMEFASEMLVKALVANSKIAETPITFHAAPKKRVAHLKTWRDGMRHLLQILLEAPWGFHVVGSILFSVSWIFIFVSLIFQNPVPLGATSIFGIHTMVLALLGSFFGITIWGIGLFLTVKKQTDVQIYRFFINLSEDKLFWYSFLFMVTSFVSLSLIFVGWIQDKFDFLKNVKHIVTFSAFISNGLLLISNVMTAHLIKRA